MPSRRCAIKDLRQNRRRHLRNLDLKTDLRKTFKKFRTLLKEKNVEEAKKILSVAYRKIDRAANHHILHKNTAARRKSRLTRLLKSIA